MSSTETHAFQAEVNQLLKLVINSLYSDADIFLRELISNASDALDRLRFRAITEPELLREDAALEVRIVPDREAGTLLIEDTGVGMTHDELVENLGTIAHSGSRALLEQLSKAGQSGPNLIGQFGVGFYSAYLVADRVDVESRPADGGAGHRWSSDAQGTFTIEVAERRHRGTSIRLYLKSSAREYLEPYRLRQLVTRYSDYVGHPIKLRVDGKDETINRASALWMRNRSEVTDEQYDELYRHLTHDPEAPLARTHFTAEGSQQFTGLLFVPRQRPFDLDATDTSGIRLFVKRVFIMDNCTELLPRWLRFVRGVVDSDDLPLNVSRQMLQDSAAVKTIRKQLVKKTLDALDRLSKERPEDYTLFWKAFGAVLKEGVATELGEQRDRLSPLLRFQSTNGPGWTSLPEYVTRMREDQPAIYYVHGESRDALERSPYLEALRVRGYEVLLLTDPIDEWVMQSLKDFSGKPLTSAMTGDLTLPDAPKAAPEASTPQEASLKPLLDRLRAVLQEHVSDVKETTRLTESPCCLVTAPGQAPAFVERLLRESGRMSSRAKRILEVNPTHPLILRLAAMAEKDAMSPELTERLELLFDQALLLEGSELVDATQAARRITSLLMQASQARL